MLLMPHRHDLHPAASSLDHNIIEYSKPLDAKFPFGQLVLTQVFPGPGLPRGLVLQSDNGTPMRGSTMISTLQWLGVVPSFSRPHVSDDNPYSEALFRTLKHTPAYPRLPFADLASAKRWITRFVDWYNGTHRHSAIRYVTSDQRHNGRERAVLASRHELYEHARTARSRPL